MKLPLQKIVRRRPPTRTQRRAGQSILIWKGAQRYGAIVGLALLLISLSSLFRYYVIYDEHSTSMIIPEDVRNVTSQKLKAEPPKALLLDPLSKDYPTKQFQSLNLSSSRRVQYLGVLIDAGRHFFPMDWLKRLMDLLPNLGFNLIHFRLTDDQVFAVRLNSYYPEYSLVSSDTNRSNARRAYSRADIQHLVAYAKDRGIVMIPELNVPGHAASWSGISAKLTLHCPKYICLKGYGIPLNVSHPELRSILKNVIEEVMALFDNPPFLHLGGDELEFSDPCVKEANERNQKNTVGQQDYRTFEHMLRGILDELKIPESSILRWEAPNTGDYERVEGLRHFWQGPAPRPKTFVSNNSSSSYWTSKGLYFDTNKFDWGWDIYKTTRDLLDQELLPRGITVGTFELGPRFWLDRNVISRLVAVSLGVSSDVLVPGDRDDPMTAKLFYKTFRAMCTKVGLDRKLCWMNGRVLNTDYEYRWKETWNQWIDQLCQRATTLQ